jgi:hypothetical protein
MGYLYLYLLLYRLSTVPFILRASGLPKQPIVGPTHAQMLPEDCINGAVTRMKSSVNVRLTLGRAIGGERNWENVLSDGGMDVLLSSDLRFVFLQCWLSSAEFG